jgi:hypothetical protein
MYKSVFGRKAIRIIAIVLLFLSLIVSGREATRGLGEPVQESDKTMRPPVPQSLKTEHEELHAQLARAVNSGGATSSAAEAVGRLLRPHFVKEEEYALPPLGLLRQLAEGKLSRDMKDVVVMTDKLKAELPRMLEEHKAVVAALEQLVEAARKEGKTEHIRFAEDLMLHARNEEEVLYPAAILVGEHLKLRLER